MFDIQNRIGKLEIEYKVMNEQILVEAKKLKVNTGNKVHVSKVEKALSLNDDRFDDLVNLMNDIIIKRGLVDMIGEYKQMFEADKYGAEYDRYGRHMGFRDDQLCNGGDILADDPDWRYKEIARRNSSYDFGQIGSSGDYCGDYD